MTDFVGGYGFLSVSDWRSMGEFMLEELFTDKLLKPNDIINRGFGDQAISGTPFPLEPS